MFEVGEKVRIKSWDQMVEEFGVDEDGDIKCNLSFLPEMKHLCEIVITIDEINDSRIQDIGDWTISFDMIEKI